MVPDLKGICGHNDIMALMQMQRIKLFPQYPLNSDILLHTN